MRALRMVMVALTVAAVFAIAAPVSAGESQCSSNDPPCRESVLVRGDSGQTVTITYTNDTHRDASIVATQQRLGMFANERTIFSGELGAGETATFSYTVPDFRRGQDAALIRGRIEGCEGVAVSAVLYVTRTSGPGGASFRAGSRRTRRRKQECRGPQQAGCSDAPPGHW